MTLMQGLWLGLSAALLALAFTKQTRAHEVAFLGGWGIVTGAMMAGATSISGLSFSALWNGVF